MIPFRGCRGDEGKRLELARLRRGQTIQPRSNLFDRTGGDGAPELGKGDIQGREVPRPEKGSDPGRSEPGRGKRRRCHRR